MMFGMMLYSATRRNVVSGFFGSVTEPVTRFSNLISQKVSRNLDMLVNAEKYYEDNQQLKRDFDALYAKIIDYENTKKENLELRKSVGIKEANPEYNIVPLCNIIGRTTNDPFKSFTIDKGSKDGIKLHDPVVVGNGLMGSGLVGIVIEVYDSQSVVKTILSGQSLSIGAICAETGETGLVEGTALLAKDGKTKMVLINPDNSIEQGFIIKTSGESKLFPKDYPIGIVDEVMIDSSGLTACAVITPIADIEALTSVAVIINLSERD